MEATGSYSADWVTSTDSDDFPGTTTATAALRVSSDGGDIGIGEFGDGLLVGESPLEADEEAVDGQGRYRVGGIRGYYDHGNDSGNVDDSYGE